MLGKAKEIAQQAHANQVDKSGAPYIKHPLRIMDSMDTVEEKIVAVLHDAVKDSDLSLTSLVELGFSKEIVAAIDAITKRPQEDYEVYLNRVISNAIALKVKIADMLDNMDMSRIRQPTEKDYKRLKKYQETLPRLLAAYKSREKDRQLY